MKTLFPHVLSRSDYRRVSSLLRAMRRAARLFIASGDVGHLNYASACRSSLSAYRA